jgi:muramoyltetrapeptide carboxypeptidase
MPSSTISRIKPPALRQGDMIGIIAPASNVKRADLEAGCEALKRAGYRPFYFDSILDQDLYFAGSIDRRARELESMFSRDDIRAIVCARGGYGSNYLLENLPLATIKAHPKIFAGYSDMTCLLTYLADATGLITFHGPMAAKDWAHADGVDISSWNASLASSTGWEINSNSASGMSGLTDGAAEGTLYGGCLSILAASLGTPYEIRAEDTILFLEDVATKPFQVDRMLMQLKLAGKLNSVRGIIFGEMLDCRQNGNQSYTLQEVIVRILSNLGIPVAYGLRSGHVTNRNITLPLGVRASLTVQGSDATLKILDPAVTA